MTSLAALIILSASAVTAFISGIFGMAGGIILMGVLIALPSVSVAEAMIIHGAIQMVANGWRAFLLREHIDWTAMRRYSLGALIGVGGLFAVTWQPDKQQVYLLLGLAPLLIWLPKERMHLDIKRRPDAVIAGILVQGLNTLAGVAGPLLDLFFVRAEMDRKEIVATKSMTQMLSHIIKIGFWSVPVVSAAGWAALPPIWFLAAAIPIAMTGTWLGGRVLAIMSDVNFKAWMKYLVTAIGLVMLLRAAAVY
ncbi:MAG: sulfite exporter TauE/SafE family protein [Hyphomonadaceae bacterium]|nr:sulfite exporter TauE/SafE family protein [Hyphomonadaceae bacterium]